MKLIKLVCIATMLLLLIFTAIKGLAFPDEGYILNTGKRILEGQIPYRDFDFVYTPLTGFVAALSFILFGQSILAERIIALLLSFITLYFLLRFSNLLTGKPLLQMIPAIIYVAWGPTHINFIWPSMLAINLSVIAFSVLLEGISKKNNKFLYLAGVFVALVVMTKQNLGVAAIISTFIVACITPRLRNWRQMRILLLGFLIPLCLFLIYTAITGSTWAFLTNSYIHVIQLVLLQGSISTPLLIGQSMIIALAKLLFYSSPLLLSLITVFMVWRKDKFKLIPLIFVIMLFLFGVRPVTDYVHLSPLLSLSGIPLLILLTTIPTIQQFNNFSKQIVFILLTSFFILLAGVGLWSSLFFGYYRWSPPLITQNNFANHPRVMIWTDNQTTQQIKTIQTIMDNYTHPKEEVFLNYYAPMVYFLTDRRNPTRYDYTGLPIYLQKDVVQTLERKNIKTVIQFYLNSNGTSIIDKYIRDKYVVEKSDGEYEIWRRKKELNRLQ